MSKRMGTAAFLAASVVAGALVHAHPRPNDVTVEIVDEHGSTFAQMPARRESRAVYRAYVQAERGARYRVRVTNRGGERLGLVIAVDGRNIISGARSDLRRSEAMYILGPWETEEYSGWRTSLSDVHEFYFTDWQDSYAEAFGDRSARGVIAVAVYREKPTPALLREQERRARATGEAPAPAPAAAASAGAPGAREAAKAERSEPGTGYGERREEPARRVAFDAAPRASSRVFLKYEWRESLCRKAIIDCGEPQNRFWPEDTLSFAPPPPRASGRSGKLE